MREARPRLPLRSIYLEFIGWKEITEREEMLTAQLLAGMKKIPGRAYSGKRGRKGALRNCELYRG